MIAERAPSCQHFEISTGDQHATIVEVGGAPTLMVTNGTDCVPGADGGLVIHPGHSRERIGTAEALAYWGGGQLL